MTRAKYLPPFSLAFVALGAACGGSQDEPAAATAGESTASVSVPAQTPAADEKPSATGAAGKTASAPATALASDFTLPDLDGKPVTLSSFRGKTVVLEWFNPGCPFVQYAHSEGPLKEQARKRAAQGIVWLAVNSGAGGRQGAALQANRQARGDWAMDYPILLDANGQVGKSYGAKTTPHMYVIDPSGSLVYRGALDNAPLGKVPSAGRINYVDSALDAVASGRPVQVAETKSYGCSVKYAFE